MAEIERKSGITDISILVPVRVDVQAVGLRLGCWHTFQKLVCEKSFSIEKVRPTEISNVLQADFIYYFTNTSEEDYILL